MMLRELIVASCVCVLVGCGSFSKGTERPLSPFESMNRATSISNGRTDGPSGADACRYSSSLCSTEPTSLIELR